MNRSTPHRISAAQVPDVELLASSGTLSSGPVSSQSRSASGPVVAVVIIVCVAAAAAAAHIVSRVMP